MSNQTIKNQTILAAAITASLAGVSGTATATTVALNLVSDASYSGNGSSLGNVNSSTATWSYDNVTNLLSQTGGTFNVRFTIVPSTTLFRHSITGLVIGNGAAAGGSTYTCTEGNFGAGVGASLCGNYNFGGNFTNESSATWGPGVAAARTIGGDDMTIAPINGPQQTLAAYDAFTTTTFVGGTAASLILSNASCNALAPGNANSCFTNGGFNQGYTWTLAAPVPIPATAWLLGTGVLGMAGRRLRRKKA